MMPDRKLSSQLTDFYETWHEHHVVRNQPILYSLVSILYSLVSILSLFKAEMLLAWRHEIMRTVTVYCISGKGPLKTERDESNKFGSRGNAFDLYSGDALFESRP
jgi:hypothetical protein